MTNPRMAHLTHLTLSRADIRRLKITDTYSLHRVVYSLFEDIRSAHDKKDSLPSGILWADKGGDFQQRNILILSTRPPTPQENITTKPISERFLQHPHYAFTLRLNPTKRDNATRKIIPLRTRDEITQWAHGKSATWGFQIEPQSFQVQLEPTITFPKGNGTATYGSSVLTGQLTVTNAATFQHSFTHGIGRAKAFGFGLLQIMPLTF